jgi:hypothetical protein
MKAIVAKIALHAIIFLLLIILTHVFSYKIYAQSSAENLPSITVINLIRSNELGHEKDDLYSSIKSQWEVTKNLNINATWLLQYSILENKQIINFSKSEMRDQEFGLLFEIDRNFTKAAGVQYRGRGPWYFSDGLFLFSYDISERKRLIDLAFSKFKENFGYYPKTVGAWWTGADSLTYMQEKYGITSSLRASDQFNLDFYSIWGTPWSIPYISSKNNQAIPAKDYQESTKVVNLQWAARDPVRGYNDPLYSIQDYFMKNYDTNYVDYLTSIFLNDEYSNLVIGLENGGTIEVFKNYYQTVLKKAKNLERNNKAKIVLSKDYADKFLSQKKVLSDRNYYLSKDYLSNDQSFWYISQNYRIFIQKIGDKIYLSDLRDYSNKYQEDFKLLPNSQAKLFINTKYHIDSMSFPNKKMFLGKVEEPLTVKSGNNNIILLAGSTKVGEFNQYNVKLFQEQNKELNYVFNQEKNDINIVNILISIYVIYFIILFLRKNYFKETLRQMLILIVPLALSIPFLLHQPNYLFDKKEIFILSLIPFSSFKITDSILLVKFIPFLILLATHYLYIKNYLNIKYKYFFYSLYIFINIIYFHIFYFPLDKSTFGSVLILSIMIIIASLVTIYIFIKKTKRKISIYLLLVTFLIVTTLLSISIITSRSKYVITEFEIEALQKIQRQEKDVLYITQVNQIKPIYKSIRPAINEFNYALAERLTGKNWDEEVRPENHILKLVNYDDKIIVLSRYLGGDISNYEIEELKLKKIFDNSQIAIFEKDK